MKIEMLKTAQYGAEKYLRCGEVYDLSLALPEDTRHALEEAAKLPWLTRTSGQMDIAVADLVDESSTPEEDTPQEVHNEEPVVPLKRVPLARRG